MLPNASTSLSLGLTIAALALSGATGRSQSPAADLHRAYYLQHETGDLEGALEIYRRVAGSSAASDELVAEAKARAEAVAEDLASSDFAKLMPADALLYLEINRPGAQLDRLARQLGLLQKSGEAAPGLGISPKLIRGLLGLRGAALAITELDPKHGPTGGVAILHPGELDVVRGLIESALPASARAVEPIGGHATFAVEGNAYVTLTSRLVIASHDRDPIEAVVQRLHGGGQPDHAERSKGGQGEGSRRASLADNAALAPALACKQPEDLLFFCANLEPLMPMLQEGLRRDARRHPEALAAMAFLDLESARFVVARAGVGDDGISFDLGVELAEGHHNLAFNLLRMPSISADALASIPAGAAFFAAAALNPPGALSPAAVDSAGEPVVTAMDFGRELFANITDVALFAMPRVHPAPWGPMPEVALSLRVNNPAQSRALWQMLLSTAQAASGGPRQPSSRTSGDVAIDGFDIRGVPVLLATQGNHLLLSLSEHAITSSLEARSSGRTVAQDPAFASVLGELAEHTSGAAALNAGRCGDIASHFMPERQRREAEPFLNMLRDTSLSLGIQQTANRLAVSGRLAGIPNVGPLMEKMISRETGWRRRATATGIRRRAPMPEAAAGHAVDVPAADVEAADVQAPEAPATQSGGQLRAEFVRQHQAGNIDAARAIGEQIHAAAREDPNYLNSFAWALLTEERFDNQYDQLALRISETANEATGWNNWYYLDTCATALGRTGQIDRAVEIQRKAVELGRGDPRVGEAEATLERLLEQQAARADR